MVKIPTVFMTIAETAAWLKSRDSFLILTHRRPDGDTIGCAGALAQGLREIGKTAYILNNPETTPRYAKFIDDYMIADEFCPENIITIDTASYDLFPKNGDIYKDKITLSIDHHPSNTNYAQSSCIDGTRASCGEIIYDLLISMTGKISAKSAECLYTALSTDTGCFAFANTTANTLRVAALLVEAGAPHRELNRLLFRTRTKGRIKIEGMIYSGLEFHFSGAVAISTITRSMMESANADEDDVDDIASIPGSIEGVSTGITLRELTTASSCKVSVRTGPTVDAHSICERFGGGGHPMAAGFTYAGTIAEVKKELLESLKDIFP